MREKDVASNLKGFFESTSAVIFQRNGSSTPPKDTGKKYAYEYYPAWLSFNLNPQRF